MIKDFLIISFTGKNDKIGLKINNNFYVHDFQIKIQNNEMLAFNHIKFNWRSTKQKLIKIFQFSLIVAQVVFHQ